MAGYLYQRIKGASVQYAGEFAAAMATIKFNLPALLQVRKKMC
jgi:sugar/nucleoside kinase (ribokinase family)